MSSPEPEGVDDDATMRGPVDLARAEAAVREFLLAIGEDPDREGLLETPGRVAGPHASSSPGCGRTPPRCCRRPSRSTTKSSSSCATSRCTRPASTTCCPSTGSPTSATSRRADGKVTGLSKLGRLVEVFARRPQVQERITTQVADALVEHLGVQGVIVVIEAEHLCMSMRGVQKPGSRTITSAVRGQLRDPATRAEAMSLLLGGKR